MPLQSLEIYIDAISISQDIWTIVEKWSFFHKDTVGKQIVRSTDSISANIAEGYGRYFYKERRLFLFYSRGSLLESLTWIEIAKNRKLIPEESYLLIKEKINRLHFMINGFIRKISKDIQSQT